MFPFSILSGNIWDWNVIILVRKILLFRGAENPFYVASFLRKLID
ncbi:MAG: hypothetical protein ACI8PB_002292 [Desulforhopalus sp.]|jgi:hypothetical protein